MQVKICIMGARTQEDLRVMGAFICGRFGFKAVPQIRGAEQFETYLNKLCGEISLTTGKRCFWDNRVDREENPFGEKYTVFFDECFPDYREELRDDVRQRLASLPRFSKGRVAKESEDMWLKESDINRLVNP